MFNLLLLLLSPESNPINKFELHYFFNDDSHNIDAFIKNKNESEILALVNEISSVFEISLEIESEPDLNGGFKQIWKFISKNSIQITLVITLLNSVLSRFPTANKKLENLQETNLDLDNQEKEIILKKLRDSIKEQKIDQSSLIDIKDSVDLLIKDLKILKHRSNFYNNLVLYPKLTHITTTILTDDYKSKEESKIVNKNDFDKFILQSDNLPIIIDDEADIEIVSPVLKQGKYKWKGLYRDAFIEFYMKDSEFKNSILQQKTTFKNGVSIHCVLEISKKINEVGIEHVVNYSVNTVISMQEGGIITVTEQGNSYKKAKDLNKSQIRLDLQ